MALAVPDPLAVGWFQRCRMIGGRVGWGAELAEQVAWVPSHEGARLATPRVPANGFALVGPRLPGDPLRVDRSASTLIMLSRSTVCPPRRRADLHEVHVDHQQQLQSGPSAPTCGNVASGTLTTTFTDPGVGAVDGAAFSPDGTMLAIADDNGNGYLRDVMDMFVLSLGR
jgi:hypothetical protein